MEIDTQSEADDVLDVHRRSRFEVGTKRYFNGHGQFDGHLTEEDALSCYRDEENDCGTSVGATIMIVARQFSGIYEAEIEFGTQANPHGGLRASAWRWKRPIPACISFYEVLHDWSDTPGHEFGNDINKLLMGQYSFPWGKVGAATKKVLRVACWFDLGANEYAVQLRRVKTHIGTPPAKEAAD